MINIPFTKYSKLWAILSTTIMVVCIALVVHWGLKPGIDFTGGSLLEMSFSALAPENKKVESLLKEINVHNGVVQGTNSGKGLLIRTPFLTEEVHKKEHRKNAFNIFSNSHSCFCFRIVLKLRKSQMTDDRNKSSFTL